MKKMLLLPALFLVSNLVSGLALACNGTPYCPNDAVVYGEHNMWIVEVYSNWTALCTDGMSSRTFNIGDLRRPASSMFGFSVGETIYAGEHRMRILEIFPDGRASCTDDMSTNTFDLSSLRPAVTMSYGFWNGENVYYGQHAMRILEIFPDGRASCTDNMSTNTFNLTDLTPAQGPRYQPGPQIEPMPPGYPGRHYRGPRAYDPRPVGLR
jgi:uncharacterized membrane protein